MNISPLLSVLRGNWFLIGLMSSVTLGFLGHTQLQILTQAGWLQTLLVVAVMWMMSAPVPLEQVRKTLSKPGPGFLAAAVNMGVLPLIALGVAPLLNRDLSGGLLVAATVPSTLASAAVWTRRAGGDDTVAIFVTLLTNFGCVIVTPIWLILLLGVSVKLDLLDLIGNLALIVILPISVAQLMRMNRRFSVTAERSKVLLGTICQVGILIMVLFGAVQMGERLSSGSQDFNLAQVGLLIVLASGIHLAALGIAWYAAAALGIQRPQRIAVSLSGSQKTLMIGLKLAIDCGVSILPMVVFHIAQLILDTLIVQRWSKHGPQAQKTSRPETVNVAE